MADKQNSTATPDGLVPQASQRGMAGLSPTARAVREQVRAGEVPATEDLKTAHSESGYRYPDEFYELNPELEAQKINTTEKNSQRDEQDHSDPAVAASLAAAEAGQQLITDRQARSDETRDQASVATVGLQTKAGQGAASNKALSGPGENKAAANGQVNFASDEAAESAADAGLTTADFRGIEPSGASGGYTKADVAKAAAAKEAK